MTFETIVSGAYKYNRSNRSTLVILYLIALFFAGVALVAALLYSSYGVALAAAMIAVVPLKGTTKIQRPQKTQRNILEQYIAHILVDASMKKLETLNSELRQLLNERRQLKSNITWLRRYRQIALSFSLKDFLKSNAEATEDCITALAQNLRLEQAMRAELEGFQLEFRNICIRASYTVERYFAVSPSSLLEKTQFARYINMLVENAKHL